MYLVKYLEKYYTEAVNKGKHFSRSNLNDARDISLLKTTQWFLMEIRMGLFRETGRVRPHVFLLFTFTLKALQDQALVLFPTSSPPHPCSQHSKSRSHLFAPWTFLHIPLALVLTVPFAREAFTHWSLQNGFSLITQIPAFVSLASLNGEAPSILLIFLFSDHDCIPIIIFDFPDGSFANVSYFTNYCKF